MRPVRTGRAVALMVALAAGAVACGGRLSQDETDAASGVAVQSDGSSGLVAGGGSQDASVLDSADVDEAGADATLLGAVDASDDSPADATTDALRLPDGAVCFPSSTQCSATQVQTCEPSGQWGPPTPCPAIGATCQGTSCQCPPGQSACDGACIDTTNDNANCGGCGLACPTSCTNGRCIVTLTSLSSASPVIAVDSSFVYVGGEYYGGSIVKVPIDGGAATTMVQAQQGVMIRAIAVHAQSLYWATNVSFGNGAVSKIPLGGGTPTVLASGIDVEWPSSIAVGSAFVYWTIALESGGAAWLTKVPVGGGNPTTLGDLEPDSYSIAIDSTNAYWLNNWFDPDAGTRPSAVREMPLAGGQPATLVADSDGDFWDLAIDGSNIYWAAASYVGPPSKYGIWKMPIAGGAPQLVAQGDARRLALGGGYIYWGDGAGVVWKTPTSGGASTIVADSASAQGGGGVTDIAVDATSVYWAYGASVLKVTPR